MNDSQNIKNLKIGSVAVLCQVLLELEAKGKVSNTEPVFIYHTDILFIMGFCFFLALILILKILH